MFLNHFIDRNPQKYVDNIFLAEEEDFIKSSITVYGSSAIQAGGKVVSQRKVIRP